MNKILKKIVKKFLLILPISQILPISPIDWAVRKILELERVYKLYNLKPVDIINCSEKSLYTPFKKLSYDQTFTLLKS